MICAMIADGYYSLEEDKSMDCLLEKEERADLLNIKYIVTAGTPQNNRIQSPTAANAPIVFLVGWIRTLSVAEKKC